MIVPYGRTWIGPRPGNGSFQVLFQVLFHALFQALSAIRAIVRAAPVSPGEPAPSA